MVQKRAWLCEEPTLEEIMADPIVHHVMRYDRITPEEVWRIIRAVKAQLRDSDPHVNKAA